MLFQFTKVTFSDVNINSKSAGKVVRNAGHVMFPQKKKK